MTGPAADIFTVLLKRGGGWVLAAVLLGLMTGYLPNPVSQAIADHDQRMQRQDAASRLWALDACVERKLAARRDHTVCFRLVPEDDVETRRLAERYKDITR